MAPGRKRGAKGVKTKSELSLGDLVLAKVKGFPAWPAKISRPEDWKHAPDPKKYFVHFFGTAEIAFVAPSDIQVFTSEAKSKLSARCQGKTGGDFAQAVKEISEEFDMLQRKKFSRTGDDNDAAKLASKVHSADPVEDEALEVSADDEIDGEEPKCNLEISWSSDQGSGFGRSQRKGEMEFQNVIPCSLDDIDNSLPPYISPGMRSKLSASPSNPPKDSVSGTTPSRHASVKQEGSCNVKAEGRCSDGGQSKLAEKHRSKLSKGPKRKHEELLRNSGSIKLPKNTGDGMQMKCSSGGNMKVPAADNSTLDSDLGSGRKGTKLLKEKKHHVAVNGQLDISEEHNEVNPSKKAKLQHDRGKLTSRIIETSSPAKILKSADTVDGAKMPRAQTSRKTDHISPIDKDTKVDKTEFKQLASGGKAENNQPSRLDTINNPPNQSAAKDDPPLKKRDSWAEGMVSTSDLIYENGNSTSNKNGLGNSNKVRSSGMQLPKKRRAVRIFDDDDDELPKTPVHGGVSQGQKISANTSTSELKKKTVKHDEGYAKDRPVLRKSGIIDDALKNQVLPYRVPKKTSSPTAEKCIEKRSTEAPSEYLSPNQRKVDSEMLSVVEAKSAADSPTSVGAINPVAEPQKKPLSKTSDSISQKKVLQGASRSFTTASDGPSLKQPTIERNNLTLPGEKNKSNPLVDFHINDSVLLIGNAEENVTPLDERLNAGSDSKTSLWVNSKISDSVTSMKHLIAAAQARKKQAHSQNSYLNQLQLVFPDADMLGLSPSPNPGTLPVESKKPLHLDVRMLHPNPPSSDVRQFSSISEHEKDKVEERRVSSGRSSLSGDTEAAVARDAFEGMIETLSRTKESIGRATRLSIDCAKYGIAKEVVELLIRKLENESSFHRRVDLFFLVDSITQCSHSQKGIAGESYLPIIQAALPRLIRAAAPPGTAAHENRRQCHKVLRLWLERKIFPESALRRHMDDIGAMNGETSTGIPQRRPSRAERAFDDPIRDMEGMLVDEYGSNATFQLSGLLLSHLFDKEDEDEENIPTGHKEVSDISPSEHTPASKDLENSTVTPSDRRHCILEDVDGELEMEDVSAQPKDEGLLSTNSNSDGPFPPVSSTSEFIPSPEGTPPLPPGSPPMTPPLPSSPPPLSSSPPPPPPPSPPPPPPPPSSDQQQFTPPPPPSDQQQFPPPPPPPPSSDQQQFPPPPPPPPSSDQQQFPPPPPPPPSSDQQHFPPPPPPPPSSDQQHFPPPPPMCLPPFIFNQSLPPPPALMPQHMPPPQSTISSSQPLTCHPPPLGHDVGGTPTVNHHIHVVSNTPGSLIDAPIRGEVFPQQPSFFPPAAVSNMREIVGSRPVEYGKSDGGYLNTQASQQRQPFLPGTAPFVKRPHHESISQQAPSRFTYPNTGPQQNMYPSYPAPNFLDGISRNTTDDRWRMQVNEFNPDGPRRGWTTGGRPYSGQPYPHEGYYGTPMERPPTNVVNFQSPAAISRPAAPSSVHGVQMMPSRPDVSAASWRPA